MSLRPLLIPPLLSALWLLTVAAVTADGSNPDEPPPVGQILATFDQRDLPWQVRMRSLVHIARLGPNAVPVLIESLRTGSPGAREFAAQALAMFNAPAARPALDQALADGDQRAPVRIYALKALRMLGKLEPVDKYKDYVFDAERGVRGTMSGALEWKGKVSAEMVRNELAEYDLTKLDSAQVGQLAPDFELTSFSGETVRLSDFRGKQNVVLRYFKLDY